MVDGKPGTGDTPLEKMFTLVLSLWYLASISPVILSTISGSAKELRAAILVPLLYHTALSVNAFLFLENFKVCNPELHTPNSIGAIHAGLAIMCVKIYSN